MEHAKVINIREERAVRPNGRIESMIRVQFMAGEHGPFSELFTREEMERGEVQRRVEEFARKIVDAAR